MESFSIQQCCQTCRASCAGNFKKVLTLMDSRLNIYIPISIRRADERIILHNTGNCPILKSELMNELNQYKELCPMCQLFIKKMRNLVSNIIIINIKEIRIVCNNCKNFKTLCKRLCKRCNEVIIKYILEQENNSLYDKQNVKMIAEVSPLLEFIETDDRQMKNKSDSLEELLRMIKVKRRFSHPSDVNYKKMSEMIVSKDKSENEDLKTLQESICKASEGLQTTLNVQNVNLSNEELYFEKSCVCKYVAKKLQTKLSPYNVEKKQSLAVNNVTSQENLMKTDNLIEISNKKAQSRNRLPAIKTKKNKTKIQKEITSKEKSINVKEEENSDTFMKMITERRKNRKRDDVYNIKRFERIDFDDWPELPAKDEKASFESVYEESESTVECENLKLVQPTDMIKGTTIVQHDLEKTALSKHTFKPLLFEVTHNFVEKTESDVANIVPIVPSNEKRETLSQYSAKELQSAQNRYQLSNVDYIENGWTVLPKHKIMRQLNIYKMVPATSTFDWYANQKGQKKMFYETGEILADINDGQGRWYYKDGHLALNFFKTADRDSNKMYCVYDAVTKIKNEQRKDGPVLAYFDFMGYGIVYDRFGKTRLKYNQSEGVLVDSKIGPPAKWKWHTLNDPPTLVGVYQEKYLKPHDKYLDKLTSDNKVDKNNITDEMSEIELNNSVREILKKVSLKYKPLEIRSKVFKLNNHFSLKILSQSKIYLLFRDGERSLKLNLGMKLLTNEIVGVETVDATDVIKDIEIRQFNKL